MLVHFEGKITEFTDGIDILSDDLNIKRSSDGVMIKVEPSKQNRIEVSFQNNVGLIRYPQKIHFFRALGLFLEEIQKSEQFEIAEEPQFDLNGGMFDCSRNGVLRVDSIKKCLRKMSIMGLNMMMLYTEDTYSIEGEPLFGYMRGRYSESELREIDDYADKLGIEIIPCIQTLAHLSTFLQWKRTYEIRDTPDVLLVGSEETYALIDKMIASITRSFRSKRIHLGMDEAHGLGRGSYFDKYGPSESFEIMSAHLKQVQNIASKYHLKPMIWSDMYFRMGSAVHGYYDLDSNIPSHVIKEHPKDVQLVYWDYYHNEPSFYEKFIQKHDEFGVKPVFAGSVWTYSGLVTNYEKTFITTNAALTACKKQGVKEVIAAIWMDNGAENNHYSALLGLQLYAEHGYHSVVDDSKLKSRFEFCTGGQFQAFKDLSLFDTPPKAKWTNFEPDNPAKYLLWQDVLLGLFDKHVEGIAIAEHYTRIELIMKEYATGSSAWSSLFNVPWKLASVLKVKADMGLKIYDKYHQKDTAGLKEIADQDLPQLAGYVRDLKEAHRKQWFEINKAFGWEILDIRYGGLLARIETAIQRLNSFNQGEIKEIEELEEEKLSFDQFPIYDDKGIGRVNKYTRIASVNVF